MHSFVGEDASGSFGMLAGHARFMTALSFGLARFRRGRDAWQYLALPGAVLYFAEQRLWIGTAPLSARSRLRAHQRLLREQLLAEEQALHEHQAKPAAHGGGTAAPAVAARSG